MSYKSFFAYLSFLFICVIILFAPYLVSTPQRELTNGPTIRVLTYSSFMHRLGAGPEISRIFEAETGVRVQWINAGNAGLMLERLKFKQDTDRPDLVLGLDQFSIYEARRHFRWRELRSNLSIDTDLLPQGARFEDFVAFDWGALTFIYRDGELPEPKTFSDLTQEVYKDKIILQDPRVSSPGLQFLLWVIGELGEQEGLDLLAQLKPSIRVVTSSWSGSYNLFRSEPSTMVFSYFTSPHAHREEAQVYRAARMKHPHPIQVEYVGMPDFCNQCDLAKDFVAFLLRPDIQKVIMEKNFMYPVVSLALEGSDFPHPEDVEYLAPIESQRLIEKKRELVNRWKKVFF